MQQSRDHGLGRDRRPKSAAGEIVSNALEPFLITRGPIFDSQVSLCSTHSTTIMRPYWKTSYLTLPPWGGGISYQRLDIYKGILSQIENPISFFFEMFKWKISKFQHCNQATRHEGWGGAPNFCSANRQAYVPKSPNPEGIGMKLNSVRERYSER